MAAAFGAPVTEAAGKSARKTSASPAPGSGSPAAAELICQTVGRRSTAHSSGTSTVPGRHTRLRSFRAMSRIIRFSARSFSERARARPRRRSSSGQRPRAAVPFMGRVVSRRPSRRRNSSGEADATSWSSRRR